MGIKNSISANKKKISDLSLNMGGILLFNVVLQFILYPFFQSTIGKELYGVALTMMSFISITANSFGTAGNYSRIINESALKPSNGDYNVFLLIGCVVSIVLGIVFLFLLRLLSFINVILFSVLLIATTFRYYADVEFKYNKNFVKFFLFYLALSLGYLLGAILFKLTKMWMTAIILGEIFAVIFSVFASNLFKTPLKPSINFSFVLKSAGILAISSVFENLTTNADRLILLALCDGTTVSVFYVASLFGKVVALLSVPMNALIISYLVHYNKPLTKKLWLIFIGGTVGISILAYVGCIIGSHILLPVLYKELFTLALPYLVPSIISQIAFFSSGILLVVLLRFFGERKQFLFNLFYFIVFFGLTIYGTISNSLSGFVYSSLVANLLRLAVVIVFGFLPLKQNIIEKEQNQNNN